MALQHLRVLHQNPGQLPPGPFPLGALRSKRVVSPEARHTSKSEKGFEVRQNFTRLKLMLLHPAPSTSSARSSAMTRAAGPSPGSRPGTTFWRKSS